MEGATFRRKVKELERNGMIKELFLRGYLLPSLIPDIDLYHHYLTSKLTYRQIAKALNCSHSNLVNRVKRVK